MVESPKPKDEAVAGKTTVSSELKRPVRSMTCKKCEESEEAA
jgi:hypothetical protein